MPPESPGPNPNPPLRSRFYYGWVIVAVAFLGETVASGAGSVAFGVFMRPMTEALGWSRTAYTGAVTFQSLANLVVQPIVGPLIDRHGARGIMVAGALMAGLCFGLMSGVTEPWQFYLLYALGAAMGLHELGNLVSGAVVSKWFIKKRGRALAFAGLGLNTGAIVASSLIAYLIDAIGWRNAWLALGILVAGVVVPPTWALMRRTPEDLGLLPDGEPARPAAATATTGQPIAPPRVEEPRWTLKEALRLRTTWFLLVAINFYSLAAGTLVYHQAAYFMDAGFSLQVAGMLVGASHAITLPTKVVWGFAAERVSVRYCLLACYVLRLGGLLALLLGGGPERVYASVLFTGLGQGVGGLFSLIWADYYGRAFIGTIRGVLGPFSIVSSLAGPLFAAWVYDATGSYDGAFWTASSTLFVALFMLWIARPPKRDRSAPVTAASSATVPATA